MSYLILARQYISRWSQTAAPADTVNRNIRFLYLEIIFAGMLGVATTFSATFAIRLGASKETVALLNSLPFLVAAVFSMPAGRFMKTREKRKRWLLGMLLTNRAGYLVVAVIPLLFPGNLVLAATIVVWWIIFLTVPATFFDNEWRVSLGELIPEKRRPFVFSRRSILSNVILAVGTVIVGWLLNQTAGAFPSNYEMMYALGFIISMGSQYFLSQLVLPDRKFEPADEEVSPSVPKQEPIQFTPQMKRLLIISGLYNFGIQIYIGVSSIYIVNSLKATDDWVGLISAAGFLGAIFGYYVWERLLRRHDLSWALRRATLFTWIYPAVLGMVRSLPIIVFANLLVNLMHPGVDLASTNMLLQLPRPQDRNAFTSRYIAIVSVGALIGPPLGAWLSDHTGLGITGVILLSAVLRFGCGVLFNVFKV
jgi:MFS family permease